MELNDGNTKNVILEEKIHQYAETFTIHGLAKILTGNKTERLFWQFLKYWRYLWGYS